MGATTNIASGGLVTFEVKVTGKSISASYDVKSVTIEKRINRISTSTITVLDGNVSDGTFEASSSEDFVPGKEVSISCGYDSKNELVFEGIITKQSIRIDSIMGSVLIVECKDKAIKTIVGRKSLTFSKQKDSDIISSIIGKYAGLSAEVTATSTTWDEQVQHYATDWDFILSRAESNGLVVTTLNNKITVFPPDKSTTSVLEIAYGNNLLEFNADLDAVTQLGNVKANSWDAKTQKIISEETSNSFEGPGNLTCKDLSKVVGLEEFELQSTAALENTSLTNWTKAQLVKSNYSKIRGEVKFQGSSLVDPGKYITLKALGDRFNGDHFISEVNHVISNGNWVTEVSVGMSPLWFTQEPDVISPPASGLLPGVQGIYNATVKKIYDDPENAFRILVDIPLFDANGEGLWARLTNFYSTSGAGAFFIPEVGDEVIVSFLNEDPRFPIILGSMYSSTNNKPFTGLSPDEKNTKKAIVSKTGIFIQFDDENGVFTIETPNKNTAIFDDKNKTITIKDETGNKIEMSDSGIVIKSPKDISIEATQSLTLKGNQGIKIESSGGDVSTSGVNVKQKANAQYSAEGSASAELKGGAQTTIKGAMVMIN